MPVTPVITASSGGLTTTSVTWSPSPTSAYYLVELLFGGVAKKSARVEHRWEGCTCPLALPVAEGLHSLRQLLMQPQGRGRAGPAHVPRHGQPCSLDLRHQPCAPTCPLPCTQRLRGLLHAHL